MAGVIEHSCANTTLVGQTAKFCKSKMIVKDEIVFNSKKRRRERALKEPFPTAWREVLEKDVDHYRRLSEPDRTELENAMKIFLAEKPIVGREGFEVTDDMRVVVAAEACLLLLHRETDYFPKLDLIVLYPSAYVAPTGNAVGGTMVASEQARLGQFSSWTGQLVLAWDHVLRGAHHADDGNNVVIHEFAHQLDSEDGSTDGAPLLPTRARYAAWAQILSQEYSQLTEDLSHNHRTVIDGYGATNPAEFFAVVTETFFEKPRQLKAKHPELYGQLADFYRQDPATL